jgi:hypothetical protein
MVYYELSLIDRFEEDTVLWTMQQDFSDELMLGLLVAGFALINEYEILHDDFGHYNFVVADEEDRYVIEVPSDIHLLDELDTVPTLEVTGLPTKGNLRVWTWAGKEENVLENTEVGEEEYTEYELWTKIELLTAVFPIFLQGFISMCTAFAVDFRDYLQDLPTDHDDVKYDIPAYHLREYFGTIKPDAEYEDE